MAAAADSVADATHDLYRRYGQQIYAYCLYQLRSREEAEDAVQTTFLNAFRGLQRGTRTRFEQAWLYKIAQNVCIARRSSTGRRLRLEAPDDLEILQEVVPAATGSADGAALELMGLDDALEQMPENQRRAIVLREWHGLSYREIARELSLSQGAVEMLIFRARRTLATALEQPARTESRRRRMARTGCSAGSLVASMNSVLSGGATLKIAAVAAGAAVVGTNAVHAVVQATPVFRPHRAPVRPSVIVKAATPAPARVAAPHPVVERTAPAKARASSAAPPVQRKTHASGAPVQPTQVVAVPVETPAPKPAAAPRPSTNSAANGPKGGRHEAKGRDHGNADGHPARGGTQQTSGSTDANAPPVHGNANSNGNGHGR